jgi:hypothetical protein
MGNIYALQFTLTAAPTELVAGARGRAIDI